MSMMVRVPAGDITNLHYNFVVAEPLVVFKANENVNEKQLQIVLKTKLLACPFNDNPSCKVKRYQSKCVCLFVP